jgi:hypothetical protein
MSENEEKKPTLGTKIFGWFLIIVIIAGVWQCVAGSGSSNSTASNSSTVQQAANDLKNSPAAQVSNYAEACNFVVSLRAKGIDKAGVTTMNKALMAAGITEAASLIDKANEDIGD